MLDEKTIKKMCTVNLYTGFKMMPGDKRFLFNEDREWTVRETTDIAETIAERLYGQGVRQGQIVVLRATRSVETVFIMLALHIIGAVCTLTDAHDRACDFIKNSMVDMDPKFYITNEDAGGGISALGDWTLKDRNYCDIWNVTFDVPKGHTDIWARDMASRITLTDPSLIFFTSGSTGKSKAVLHCQENYIPTYMETVLMHGGGRDYFDDSGILILPLSHCLGHALLTAAMLGGFSLMIPKDGSPEAAVKYIDRYRLSIIYSVPTYLLAMAEEASRTGADMTSMAYALIAGGPSTTSQAEYIEKALSLKVLPLYGLSEYTTCTTVHYDDPFDFRCAGVGRFFESADGFIADEDGNPAERGKEGEICVRGPALMMGYYNDPVASAEAIDEKGYLHTGDMAFEDEKGAIHISGRKKDIIIRGGNNLSAGKIEGAIMSVEGVYQAAVVAKRDERLGEVPCAAVKLKNGYAFGEDHIREELRKSLSKIEMPEEIRIMDNFPLVSSGKADRVLIKKMFNGEN